MVLVSDLVASCIIRTSETGYCASFKCPYGTAHIENASQEVCMNGRCRESQCCGKACSSFKCRKSFSRVIGANSILCDDAQCTNEQCCGEGEFLSEYS